MSKRVEQKAAAKLVRQQIAAEDRRRKLIWTTIAVVLVALVAGGIGYGVWQAQQPRDFRVPANATAEQDGMTIPGTSGKAKVDIYLDYQCPACKNLEEAISPTVDQWIKDNKITLVYHPITILDRFSGGTKYSTRSAAAAGCASDGNKLYEFTKALFAQQPAENTRGLTDDQIISIGGTTGLIDPAFAACVRDGKYLGWAEKITDDASKRGLSSTPTMYVNGTKVDQNKPPLEELTRMVTEASK
ncbi:DsbA family protein [Longispora albida]|uniref:DsbA family protein n=1 Tax=Longispora albida TaxID=203523 RepID=UPI0003663EA1|nr:thioredoxin domain-containing protein [Longispora albida]